jgi:hypothetical protein
VVDFGGWLDNWSWSLASTGKAPRWLLASSILSGLVGLGCVAASWMTFGIGWSAWLLLPLLALPLDLVPDWPSEPDTSVVAYGHTLLLCGVLALSAFGFQNPPTGRTFATLAPCLAAGSAPLLSRIWAATLYARDMIDFAAERRAAVRAALAGENDGLVVRITRVDGDQVELVTLGAGPELLLRIRGATLYAPLFLREGNSFWLEAPVLGELESPSGYRGPAEFRRVNETGAVHWLTRDPERWMDVDFTDEIWAGAIVMLGHHAAIVLIALALSHVLASR